MNKPKQLIDRTLLKSLVPMSSLNAENLQKLAEKTFVEQAASGDTLFKQGDIDNWSFYVLSGEVALSAGNKPSTSVQGGSGVAKHAFAQQQPRQFTATAKGPVSYIRVDSQLLDLLLTWDQQLAGYEVMEFEGDGETEWMIKLLQTPALLRLPSANIQNLFARLQEVQAKAGQVIIKQGDKGDYFYIIKKGRCRVSRQAGAQAAPAVLAELAEGDSFGEDALLSDAPRNATVTMLADGALMRLAKNDFTQLLKEPLLNTVTAAQAGAMVKEGASLLDVRLEKEFQNGNLKGSTSIPLYLLRVKAETLDRKRKYIVYCDTGRRSAAAAYLLGERGLEAYVLQGGLSAFARPAAKPV